MLFISTLKTLFILKIFKFLYCLFGHAEKQLDQKDKANSKIYDMKTWFTNNSRRKGNQDIKFGWLKEYGLINIFLKNHLQNVAETIPRSYSKNSKLSRSLDQ